MLHVLNLQKLILVPLRLSRRVVESPDEGLVSILDGWKNQA